MRSRSVLVLLISFIAAGWVAAAHPPSDYVPPRDNWEHRKPADAGMDPAKLKAAVEFMEAHETASPARDFSDQEIVFGKLLGSIPTERGATNGLIIRHGYIVAEFGDTHNFIVAKRDGLFGFLEGDSRP